MEKTDQLFQRLREFTKEVVEEYSFQQLEEFTNAGQFKQEYTENPYTDCTAEVLYKEIDADGEYICLATTGQDLRDTGLLGCVNTPVTCQVFIYSNGKRQFGPLGNSAITDEEVDF